jgi:hypothetical protein
LMLFAFPEIRMQMDRRGRSFYITGTHKEKHTECNFGLQDTFELAAGGPMIVLFKSSLFAFVIYKL